MNIEQTEIVAEIIRPMFKLLGRLLGTIVFWLAVIGICGIVLTLTLLYVVSKTVWQ